MAEIIGHNLNVYGSVTNKNIAYEWNTKKKIHITITVRL